MKIHQQNSKCNQISKFNKKQDIDANVVETFHQNSRETTSNINPSEWKNPVFLVKKNILFRLLASKAHCSKTLFIHSCLCFMNEIVLIIEIINSFYDCISSLNMLAVWICLQAIWRDSIINTFTSHHIAHRLFLLE